MVESHLKAGRQDLLPGKELVYGLSITDACIGWEDSRRLLDTLADAVRRRRLKAESRRRSRIRLQPRNGARRPAEPIAVASPVFLR